VLQGEELYLFQVLDDGSYKLLRMDFPKCVSVEALSLRTDGTVFLTGIECSESAADLIARSVGFEDARGMMVALIKKYDTLPIDLLRIGWKS